ncbi:bifunctional glycosyltransferase family 2/GtrA family protein [Granulicella paludicola]|uniref:bifunctional glycosyltransferase family 2/GtrA family protein n=1 Tax=Granulicella paludicola TaxID=474951 RepID=UPI0021DFABC1|nr:bifunctional glycosyltransferase family 2/GtrA family protein [Granulicella paludicola]
MQTSQIHSDPRSEIALALIAALIPAWQPEQALVLLVDELLMAGFGAIVLVDDGGGEESRSLFDGLEQRPRVHLVRHAVNLGKGRALKSGLNYVLNALPGYVGVVTADADGQHRAADIVAVGLALPEAASGAVLGTRAFSGDVPFRSRFGNGLTRYVFSFLTGTKLGDTQSGLRGFSGALLPELMQLDGERYEYEMTVLAVLCRSGRKPVEVPIETVYIENNRSSHFDPVRDSMRIYFVLVRFYFSAVLAAAIDFVGFTLAFAATGNIVFSIAVGRLSSLVNFAVNKKYVFQSRGALKQALWRYYALVLIIACISAVSITALTRRAHWNVYAAKIVVDTVLSLVSFAMQRTFVFRGQEMLAERKNR